MDFIKGITFGFMSKRGEWEKEYSMKSIRFLKERCNASHIILPIVANQEHTYSTVINWSNDLVLSDEEVVKTIEYSQNLGLKVILKPMVNVSDGTWRAHINFFDKDVPCEPKWSDWFSSYGEYILHYAELAEKTNCSMFVIGCELVNSDRREEEWRGLIKKVRKKYSGLLTYNCDKYQENNVKWWDALDVISSSGYYPINSWKTELSRIKKVVQHYKLPFFFCEVGCPSREGSEYIPNDWMFNGDISFKAQDSWYKAMFENCLKEEWVKGFALWDWKSKLYDIHSAKDDKDYAIYGKLAEKTVKSNYETIK